LLEEEQDSSFFHIIIDMSNLIVQHSDIIRTNILSLDMRPITICCLEQCSQERVPT